MTSLFSGTVSPSKDGTSSLPRRQNSLAKPPLRALYDLLIAPMEGVSGSVPATSPESTRGHTVLAGSLAGLSLALLYMAECIPEAQRVSARRECQPRPSSPWCLSQ